MRKMLGAGALLICGWAVLAAQPRDDAIARGKRVFDYHCSSCHGPGIGNPGNPFRPGTGALRAKYGKDLPAFLTERTDLTPEMVAFFVRNGVSVMAPYRKTEIDDTELTALGAYLSRNNPDKASR